MKPFISVRDVRFIYREGGNNRDPALNGIDFTVEKGEFISIIGANGSGKSTLARHINALLLPTSGEVLVNGICTSDQANWRDIRRITAMVFQQPESQAVATTVEEDVAFGPENLGVEPTEIRRRVDWALDVVGLTGFNQRVPHHLSGGQKQRLALAGALAMQPECIVLDEATSMLDPLGRWNLREIISHLHKQGVTIITITQDMDEVVLSDRVIVLSQGQIIKDDSTRSIMSDPKFLQSVGLDSPQMVRLSQEIHARWPDFPGNLLTVDEIVEHIKHWLNQHGTSNTSFLRNKNTTSLHGDLPLPNRNLVNIFDGNEIIAGEDLWYTYMRGTPLETAALCGVNFALRPGEIIGVMGATGSGKTTLLQHLNGLLTPQSGRLRIANIDITTHNFKEIRQKVALLFQQPEDQLFERYVADDVAYGPVNLGLNIEEVRRRVVNSMETVGLPINVYRDRPIFTLSGGERKRAALAGVLALEPKVLVMDEASAGLDPRGRKELESHLRRWHSEGDRSIVWASHSMEEVAQLTDRVTGLASGKVIIEGTPRDIFYQPEALSYYGLGVPQIVQLTSKLIQIGLELPPNLLTFDEIVPALDRVFARRV